MRWTRAAGLLAFALALAGCGNGDGESQPTGTRSESATAEPTTDVSTTDASTTTLEPWPEPTRPPEMERDDIEGATAAAVYFMELYQYMYRTGETASWESVSLDTCNFCRGAAEHVGDLYREGGRAEGGGFAIDDIIAAEPNEDYSHFRVMLVGVEAPSVELSSSGEVLQELAGSPGRYSFAVVRDVGDWRIGGVSVEEDSRQ